MYVFEKYWKKIFSFLQFIDLGMYLSTNFVENMNSALPNNRILPYFEEVLLNAVSFQDHGDLSGYSEKNVMWLKNTGPVVNLGTTTKLWHRNFVPKQMLVLFLFYFITTNE